MRRRKGQSSFRTTRAYYGFLCSVSRSSSISRGPPSLFLDPRAKGGKKKKEGGKKRKKKYQGKRKKEKEVVKSVAPRRIQHRSFLEFLKATPTPSLSSRLFRNEDRRKFHECRVPTSQIVPRALLLSFPRAFLLHLRVFSSV